jgi:hypothetical protein
MYERRQMEERKSKEVEVEVDELTGKITGMTIEGKPAKPMYMRGIKKAQETPYWTLLDHDVVATNQFSGVTRALNGLEGSVYLFCMNWYARFEKGVMDVPVQTFDDMKYLLLEINPDAYYELLD